MMAAKRNLSDDFEPSPVQPKKSRTEKDAHLTALVSTSSLLESDITTRVVVSKSESSDLIQLPSVKMSSGNFSPVTLSMPGIQTVKSSIQVGSTSAPSSSSQAISPLGVHVPINRPVGLPIHLTSANLPSGIKVTRIPTPAAIPSAHYISPVQIGPTLLKQGLGSGQASSSSSSTSFPTILPPPYSVTTSVTTLAPVCEAIELTCSSPSQFLHSPIKISSSASTSSPSLNTSSGIINVSRQPICSVELKPSITKSQSSTKNFRSRILKRQRAKLASIKLKYDVMLREKFFLEEGGDIMDFIHWKKKPNLLRDQFLKQHELSSIEVKLQNQLLTVGNITTTTSTSLPTATTIQIPLSTVSASLHPTPPKESPNTPVSPSRSMSFPSLSRRSTRAYASFSSVYENSHEDIVLRARHEAEVVKAVSELRKEGLWSASRLPKVQEPPRIKTHWDYLLEEMQWLATDFANEKKWKINAARKLSRSVAHYHRESGMQQARTEKEELLRLRKIASSIAKEVKHFWDSMQKIVEHKRNLLLEAKRKKAMDLHLEFIVDQTAKYSDWLAKGLGSNTGSVSEPSLHSAASLDDSDGFLSPPEESDDENTIAMEEQVQIEEGGINYDSEIDQLHREGEMPLDELLAFLPKEVLSGIKSKSDKVISDDAESKTQITESSSSSGVSDCKKKSQDTVEDREYMPSSEEVCTEDETLEEQEAYEERNDHNDNEEMNELLQEGELPLEELLDKYNMQQQYSMTREGSVQESPKDDFNEGADLDSSSDTTEEDDIENEEENSLESLITGVKLEEACKTEAGLSDVAAAAEKFQPKGITLATTDVKTVVPFLLKHTLREYQHIGLDWLVTMYERRLNGILADEMGLGKTIQTIALLAHLVCEKGIWGPHLIIVPTSVLLNWEYELKKWCPALKILTYFGSLKERKQKRIGWSKRNAFHICITSYNIAVTDHRAFKQKKWRYIILDEAQNIKNFKSQRWQTLLNFNSQCRLLLTGTPLQNNLMELWSLMHFLMPTVFSSHTDFKEWFSNPLSGMIEGSQEYNESIVRRLHQVLRPFLLRRLKMEVEKQMPKKYEHIVPCRLSKRQRFLYDEYMSRAKTKDSLAAGNYLSVINVLMQLRKVCNHPDLFELRPIVSPFQMEALECCIPSCALEAMDYNPFKHVNLNDLNLRLCDYELDMDAFASFRTRQLQASRVLFTDLTCLHREGVVSETNGIENTRVPSFLEDLHVPEIVEKISDWTASRYRHMHEVSSRRCRRSPVYGRDLIQAVKKISCQQLQQNRNDDNLLLPYYWLWIGYSTCYNHQTNQLHVSNMSSALREAMPAITSRVKQLDDVIKRFLIVVPAASSHPISLHAYHPQPSQLQQSKDFNEQLGRELVQYRSLLHDIVTGGCFNFPERRLIQYDCGKLQTLDILLQKLKIGDHRVLIFTQMSRMLDILEIFLNYHGFTYLRLDGSTPVQKRQYLMDRFNRDERIFCFILSTRSGGLGVNLTGADTVVFYDSDWNPTMDAQAQDRCHRIGQTRDVHIYRLICDRTVEENILKKANQKRMLGNIAIEGGAFTTDFFKQTSLRELFNGDDNTLREDMENSTSTAQNPNSPLISEKQIEELLLQAEDDGDAKAASKAKAEEVAERAEFDENFCIQDDSNKVKYGDDETAKAMSEFSVIEEQLNDIEKYAMYFLEEETAELAAEQLRVAEENIEHAKKDWELSHLLSLREEEEKVAEEEAMDDVPLTYDRPDFSNKTFREEQSGEEMPFWLPPTPPSDDTEDLYIDIVLEMQYNTQSVISPAILASMAPFSEEDYDVFGLRRQSIDIVPVKKSSKSSSKQIKEHVNVPPSLFWRRFTADTLSTKFKKLATHQKKIKTKDQFTPLLEQQPEGPEWTINEDWILLKSITGVLEFPLSLTISVPAQVPNWSIIADITSSLGRVRRSPLQCREHLMNIVIPREDGISKSDESAHETKRHKSRELSIKRSKGRKEQRTKNLVINNGNKEHTRQYSVSFDWVIQASIKRKQTPKFTWDTVQKPSMHIDLLKDYGVQVESIQSPMHTAQLRAERIQSEHPRHSTQQLPPNQPYHSLSNVVRSYSGTQIAKPVTTDLHAPKIGYNLPRPAVPSQVQTSQRLQSQNSTVSFSPSKSITSTSTSTVLSTSQVHSTSLATSLVTSLTTSVGKTLSSAGVGDLSKTLNITRGLTSQQLLLLRQTTNLHQHQQTGTTTPSTQNIQPLSSQTQAAIVQQKLSLPSGIEQLRATVASAASVLPRFANIAATSGGTVKGLTSGRTLQTEEVLALLKQQSIRMAATQSYKASHSASVSQFNPTAQLTTKPQQSDSVKLVSSPATEGVQLKVEMMDISQSQPSQPLQPKPQQTTAAQIKAQIQALAAQQKAAALQTRPFSGKKQS